MQTALTRFSLVKAYSVKSSFTSGTKVFVCAKPNPLKRNVQSNKPQEPKEQNFDFGRINKWLTTPSYKEIWYDPNERRFLLAPTRRNYFNTLAIFLLGVAGVVLVLYKGKEYIVREFSDVAQNEAKVKKMILLNPPHDGYRLRTYIKTYLLMKGTSWLGLVDKIDLSEAMKTLSYGLYDTDWSHRYLARFLIDNAFKDTKLLELYSHLIPVDTVFKYYGKSRYRFWKHTLPLLEIMAVSTSNSSEIASKYTRFLLKEIDNDRLSRGRETPFVTEKFRDYRDFIIYSIGGYFTNRHYVCVRAMHLLAVLARNKESHSYLLDSKFNTLNLVVEAMNNPINKDNIHFQNYAKEFIKSIYSNATTFTKNQIEYLLESNNINKDNIINYERYSLTNYNKRWSFIWQIPLSTLVTTTLLFPTLPPQTKNTKYLALLMGASTIPSIYYSLRPETVTKIFDTVGAVPLLSDFSTMPILKSILIGTSTASVLAGTMFPYYFLGPYIVHKLDRMYHFTYHDERWDEVNQARSNNK